MVLPGARGGRVWAQCAYGSGISLRAPYTMSGTVIGSYEHPMPCPVRAYETRLLLSTSYAVPGTGIGAFALPMPCPMHSPRGDTRARERQGLGDRGIVLRTCYAMSGTDLAHGGIVLYSCYAMSGTDLAHGGIVLRLRYAMFGADIGNAATAEKRLKTAKGELVHALRAIFLRVCYAMSGTDMGYAGTSWLRGLEPKPQVSQPWTLDPNRKTLNPKTLTPGVDGNRDRTAGKAGTMCGVPTRLGGYLRRCPGTLCYSLRACYETSGTDLAMSYYQEYLALELLLKGTLFFVHVLLSGTDLCPCYEVSGTDLWAALVPGVGGGAVTAANAAAHSPLSTPFSRLLDAIQQ
eukprot:6849-Rhodomonas_salina.13